MSLDVKKIQLREEQQFNLGHIKRWSPGDVKKLINLGCNVNAANYIHVPFDIISGMVPFGRKDHSEPRLQIGNTKLSTGGRKRKII